MSEYQYYEFQAVDRPLTEREIGELRRYSTRATITSTRFVNHYEWGGLKGDPSAWMQKYFDAFLYVANWGTHELMLRFPRRVLDLATAKRYCCGEQVADALMLAPANVPPAWTLLEQALEFRTDMAVIAKGHPGEPLRFLIIWQAGDPPLNCLAGEAVRGLRAVRRRHGN